jgi:hypothetical protein
VIEIPFNAWSKDKLRKGIKHTTFRYKKYGDVGDTFQVNGKTYFIMRYMEKTGQEVIDEDYLTEGAQTPDELKKVLDGICRGKFNPNKKGWLHFFGEVA